MATDSTAAYENNARSFLRYRDSSQVGADVTERWARSLQPGSKVIEIACGGGLPITRTLVGARLKVWAIDSSPTLVSVFRKRFPGIPVSCDAALESEYFQTKFDAAIAIGLMFLLAEKDQINLMTKVAEILIPGGRFLFTAPIETGTWTDTNTGHTCISLGLKAYEDALGHAGFRVTGHYEDNGKNHYYDTQKLENRI